MSEKKLPTEWEAESGIIVHDPDGWDRRNFDESWATPIDREEWIHRAGWSTIQIKNLEKYKEFFGD